MGKHPGTPPSEVRVHLPTQRAPGLKKFNLELSDPTEIPPPYREIGVAITPVALCFPVVSQTIAATPPLLSVKMAYRSPKTGLILEVAKRTK